MSEEKKKSAFIAILGVPNVGKSTIINSLLGQKISITSPKPQTTRKKIMGIVTEQETQLILFDTPGIHKINNQLGKYMDVSIKKSVSSVDICALVTEVEKEISKEEMLLINQFKEMKVSSVLVINKIDLLKDKSLLVEQINKFMKIFPFDLVIPVSARKGDGLLTLKEKLKSLAILGPHFFPEDELTDQPEKVIISEFIREKILELLEKEIPHGIAVLIEKMKKRENSDLVDIEANIYCEKFTHKGIIIGKNGNMLKKIGTKARIEVENFLKSKVNLQLWVKVKENWRNKDNILENFGFNKREL